MSLVDPPLNMLKQGPSGLSKAPVTRPSAQQRDRDRDVIFMKAVSLLVCIVP